MDARARHVLVTLFGAAMIAAPVACRPRSPMCTSSAECRAGGSCIAGRCVSNDAGAAIAAVDDAGYSARRLVVAPVDVAWVRRGDPARPMPPVFTMGRASDGDAVLFTRFELTLPRAELLEAYLLLVRSDAVDADPSPVTLHAARIVDPWDPDAIAWATQPRTEDVRAPSTRVEPGGRALVRLDVKKLVDRWAAHDPRDHGIAVVAEDQSASGIAFAFLASPELAGAAPRATSAPAAPGGAVFSLDAPRPQARAPEPVIADVPPILSPRLELYLSPR